MFGRLVRVAALVVVLDIVAGVVLDAQLVARPWTACAAVVQRPAAAPAQACGAAVESVWTTDLPAASQTLVREARLVWKNARAGRNTV